MAVVRLLIGIVLLGFGRKLYWLFVAGAGFAAAAYIARDYIQLEPEWLVILVAVGVGIIGALLAVFLQRVAIGIAGFLAAGYGAVALLQTVGLNPGRLAWLPFIIAGVIGAVLVAVLFEWALIGLSSLSGAGLVAQSLSTGSQLTMVVFLVALVVGIAVQSAMLMAERRREAYVQPPTEDRP